MPSVSNISVGANFAGNYAHKARHEMNASIMRLSSGNRTLMGGDAGGGSLGNNLMARAKSHYVAARNAEDGISALLTAEAVANEVAALAYRLRELGIQADNDALLSSTDESALDKEAALIGDTLEDIELEAKFNEQSLIQTSGGNKTFAVGTGIDGTNETTITTFDQLTDALEGIDNSSGAEATADLLLIDVANTLGHIAAGISSLKARQSISYASSANLEAAAARIMDTDFAKETANLTKNSVLNQSAMAMVAQANQAQAAILAVLQ
jgi:flagellin